MRTKEHAVDCYPAYAKKWGTAIQLLHELATEKDVERLNTYCENNKYNEYLGDGHSEIYESWSRAFQSERLYYRIRYGNSGHEDWEPEAEEPYYYGFDREEDNIGYEYYLAYHQWNAFQGWLVNHSEARESFNQFEVSTMINRNPSLFLL